jgi:FkbM family methyltransferase
MIRAAAEAALRAYGRIAWNERGGYRLARLVRGLRSRQNWRDTFTTPDGLQLKLDLATYPDVCMAYGLYELDTTRLLKRLIKPGDHFVDAGANIGYFALLASKLVGPTGHIDAFEPHPLNRARLLEHLHDNGVENCVRVHDVALSDRGGVATMNMPAPDAGNHGMASMFASGDAVEVRMARMDESLAGAKPRVIKMDVEGAEPLAVAGMAALLQVEHPPLIIAEYNVDAAKQAGFAPREFIDRILAIQPRYAVEIIGRRSRRIADLDRDLAGRTMANLLFSPSR